MVESKIIFTVFTVLYFGVRAYWANRADKRPVKKSHVFLLDKINVGLVGIFTIIVPLLSLYTPIFRLFDYHPDAMMIYLSIPILLGGLVVFWISHRDLAENWSVTLEIKENHSLITHGIFKNIRHPMYSAIWLCAIGQALCVPNYVGGLGGLVAWTLLYFVRINKEEQMMVEKFGDEYLKYMKQTKRLIPHVL